jgi:hypothetical protein
MTKSLPGSATKSNVPGGSNYQTVINEALRQHIRRVQEPLESRHRNISAMQRPQFVLLTAV